MKKAALNLMSWLFRRKVTQVSPAVLKLVDKEALQIVDRLVKGGFESYLVGGCVRDLLMKKRPKDFDIATRATPQQVKHLIHRSFIIGRRFRIVVAKRRPDPVPPDQPAFLPHAVHPREKEFQITTFRSTPVIENGVLNENVFGEPSEDAIRRDFTINGLFLDTHSGNIIDFVGGMEDIKSRRLRMIGDPWERFKEDPVRILRALRFVHRTGLHFEENTKKALLGSLGFLDQAKKERLREEVLKIFREGAAQKVLSDFFHSQVWKHVYPLYSKSLNDPHARKVLLALAKSVEQSPWPDDSDSSPLFFVLLSPLFVKPDNHHLFKTRWPALPNDLLEELKISRKERESIDRIASILAKLERDPQAKNPGRLLLKHQGAFESINRAFYIVHIAATAEWPFYVQLWKHWSKHFKVYSKEMLTLARQRSKHGHRRRPPRSGGTSGSRPSSTSSSSRSTPPPVGSGSSSSS